MKKLLLPALVSLSLAGSMMFATPALAERDRHDRVERGEHRDRHSDRRQTRNHRDIDRRFDRGNRHSNKHYYNSHRPAHSYRSGRHYKKHYYNRHNDRYYRRHNDHHRHGGDVIRLIGGAILLDQLIRHH